MEANFLKKREEGLRHTLQGAVVMGVIGIPVTFGFGYGTMTYANALSACANALEVPQAIDDINNTCNIDLENKYNFHLITEQHPEPHIVSSVSHDSIVKTSEDVRDSAMDYFFGLAGTVGLAAVSGVGIMMLNKLEDKRRAKNSLAQSQIGLEGTPLESIPEDTLLSAGEVVELGCAFEEKTGKTIPTRELARIQTVEDFKRLI